MPSQTFNQSRRNFLKSTTYMSAVAISGVAGLSSLAMASDNKLTQHQNAGMEAVDLINHTASPVKFGNDSVVSIAPGEQKSFLVAALVSNGKSANNKNLIITDVLANDQLVIRSDYPEFNGIYPMAEFAKQAA